MRLPASCSIHAERPSAATACKLTRQLPLAARETGDAARLVFAGVGGVRLESEEGAAAPIEEQTSRPAKTDLVGAVKARVGALTEVAEPARDAAVGTDHVEVAALLAAVGVGDPAAVGGEGGATGVERPFASHQQLRPLGAVRCDEARAHRPRSPPAPTGSRPRCCARRGRAASSRPARRRRGGAQRRPKSAGARVR